MVKLKSMKCKIFGILVRDYGLYEKLDKMVKHETVRGISKLNIPSN